MAEKHAVVVYLTSGAILEGEPYEMSVEDVQQTVKTFMAAEGQGYFVLDCGEKGWKCMPTRSIDFIGIEPQTSERSIYD